LHVSSLNAMNLPALYTILAELCNFIAQFGYFVICYVSVCRLCIVTKQL